MRIGVDATSWFNERGYGRYTRELLAAMAAQGEDELVCFVDARDTDRFDVTGPKVTVVGVSLGARPTDAASADGSRSPMDMLRMTRAVKRERVDVLFFPTVYTYFPAPLGQRTLVTIHDTITERFPELTLPSARARLFWRAKVRLSLWQSRLVLTVSDFAADEIAEVLGVARKRLRVTGEASSPAYHANSTPAEIDAAREAVGLPAGARWFTYVGGFNPHKNLAALVRAHGELANGEDETPWLVLVGPKDSDVFHSGSDELQRAIAESPCRERILWPGFVPDEELRALHAGSLALCLPSLCEGFGLPAVEAAACGAPVIATTKSPLPEVLHGGGIFLDPNDAAGWAKALREMAENEDERRVMGERAAELASALTWDAAATRALAALREAAA